MLQAKGFLTNEQLCQKTTQRPRGADFTRGIPLKPIKERALLLGYAKGEAVILVRQGDIIQAVCAICTLYDAPLADGLLGTGAAGGPGDQWRRR